MAKLLVALVIALATTAIGHMDRTVFSVPPFSCSGITNVTRPRAMRLRGNPRNVTFIWHDDPSRAAAALLMAAVAASGYTKLYLRHGPRDFCSDKESEDIDHTSTVSVSWVPGGESHCHVRVPSVGEAGGHSALRLHVVQTPPPPKHSLCQYPPSLWTFYREWKDLRECGFLRPSKVPGEEAVQLYVLNAIHKELVLRCLNDTPLHITTLKRVELAEQVRNATHSFLFMDYDLWAGEKGVQTIRLPATCYHEPNPGFRAFDEYLPIYAPDIRAALQNFNPEAKYLREVLEMEEKDPEKDVLRAACQWGTKHRTTFLRWHPTHRNVYLIVPFVCTDDPDLKVEEWLPDLMSRLNKLNNSANYDIKIDGRTINCSNPDDLQNAIRSYKLSHSYYAMIGIVTNARDTRDAVKESDLYYLPMVMTREAEALGVGGTRVANGGERHISSALRGLLRHAGWSRLAFLADDSYATSVLRDGLAGFTVKYVDTSRMVEGDMANALKELKLQQPRIIFMRLDPTRSVKLLQAAYILHMTPAYGYVWVACAGPVPSTEVSHFAVSFWSRHSKLPTSEGVEAAEAARVVKRYLARDTVPLVNAILTLRRGFQLFYNNNPEYRNDLHDEETVRLFWKSYDESPAAGFGGLLRYDGGLLQYPTVYIEWCNSAASDTSIACRLKGEWHDDKWSWLLPLFSEGYTSSPTDGASTCVWRGADSYNVTCYDFAIGIIVCAGAVLVGAAAYTCRSYRQQLAQREAKVRQQLQQWKERAAGSLASYLVDRTALHFEGWLGEGRFGCVRFALLRDGAAPPRPVAVKALRENAAPAEESEFLREASVLASLEHENVIRFVGVCAGDGPPLVLMEHAFFGDLLQYLRARRHLVESEAPTTQLAQTSGVCFAPEEAMHISATALTRLAREAASALGYLASRGVVHRDVRASNCLVDARRILKLSDFGLARRVSGDGPGEGAEYACRRRGFFPVLWMAPESLKQGIFSAASDVWSFGVLVFELVTLGARPYGQWAPLRVLQFVSDGGQPPLPADTSPQTRALASLCWRRRPEQRPSAAEVVAYLATHEGALRPALWRTETEAADADSGFSGSPCNESEMPFAFASSPRLTLPPFRGRGVVVGSNHF